MKNILTWTALALILTTAVHSLSGTDSAEAGENDKLSWGGDLRMRATQIHQNTFFPDGEFADGPAVQWLRFRTRLWLAYQFTEDVKFDVRLANRWHYVRQHFFADDHPGYNPWEFPDEVIFDQLKLTIDNFADLPIRLTLGRQDVILGNGMIVLEGTPYDQGRGIYFDGLRATIREGDATVDLFGFYSREEDDFIVINNQNRRLRRGDTLLTGAYWTQRFSPEFNTDAYYLYNTIKNDLMFGQDLRLHILGGRIFGNPHELVDYSAELAAQRGKLQPSGDNMTGMMSDLRLGILLPGNLIFNPKISLQHTWMRGDDRTSETYTGWHPVAAEYPIWRDDLMPIASRGNWTNLNQSRVEGKLELSDNLSWTGAWAYLRADTTDGYIHEPTGYARGGTIGTLYSSFLDYGMSPNLRLRLEGAVLQPGNYYVSDTTAHWMRLEAYLQF